MKNNILFIFLWIALCAFAQAQQPNLLQIPDDSWQEEKIHMPLHFAPQIPYAGEEELRFSKDWSKQGTNGFWSYVFVWDIDLKALLTSQQLEIDMQYYFDGLMGVVNKDKDKKLPKTIALFLEKEAKENYVSFVGKLQIYNSFHTKDVMVLNCTVQQFYCPKKQKSLVLFRFSPKEWNHPIWNELQTVTLTEKPCNQ
ncbi:hypothetical protein C8N46_106178 [Kordia periserrulae]|uniref:Uncharacterized protein n=1 Tax=Kordia periserrulae TaxID=701523 RepID=A0A2T6BWS9_9FLAO|nr:hypothetical protein [Kordia periserrulae]PTX60532.1 hypothetical protein C8N46_106178 [Kordia periserrulae]